MDDTHPATAPIRSLKMAMPDRIMPPYTAPSVTITKPWPIHIRNGIYHETVSFESSGTESSPIHILAYPGENPVIDGGYTLPGFWVGLLNIRGNYIDVAGIEVRNSTHMGVLVYGNYDVVDNLYVHHSRENGILINHGQHSTVENSRVWRNVLNNEYRSEERRVGKECRSRW